MRTYVNGLREGALFTRARVGADDAGAPSTTVRSSAAACTAKFSAKKRASAMRGGRRRRRAAAPRAPAAPAGSRRSQRQTAADRASRRPALRRFLVEPGRASSGRARQALDRLAKPHAAPAERRIVGGVDRLDDAAQFAEMRLRPRAAGERQLAGDEIDRLDAVGAFVDRGDARVAKKLRRAGFLDIAHAAMHLHAERSDLVADVGRKRLGERRQQRGARVRRLPRGGVGAALGAVERHRGRVADGARGLRERAHGHEHALDVGMGDDRRRSPSPAFRGTRPCRRSRA
jgi:hypothetical protein